MDWFIRSWVLGDGTPVSGGGTPSLCLGRGVEGSVTTRAFESYDREVRSGTLTGRLHTYGAVPVAIRWLHRSDLDPILSTSRSVVVSV